MFAQRDIDLAHPSCAQAVDESIAALQVNAKVGIFGSERRIRNLAQGFELSDESRIQLPGIRDLLPIDWLTVANPLGKFIVAVRIVHSGSAGRSSRADARLSRILGASEVWIKGIERLCDFGNEIVLLCSGVVTPFSSSLMGGPRGARGLGETSSVSEP
jgi:hypothetical protein